MATSQIEDAGQVVATGLESFEQRLPGQKRPTYLPTLDGWRAIAILIVLFDHGPTIHVGPLNTFHFHFLGQFGVQIFFALSGLLICSRLLDEERLTGNVHLKRFYIRRLFRIQPPAILYLCFILGLSCVGRVPAYSRGILAAFFLVRNYVGVNGSTTDAYPTAHYWSLSVEEHFYILLPTFLLLIRRWRAPILITAGAADFAWRTYLLFHASSATSFQVSSRTDTSLCFLLLPAGLAVLLRKDRARHFVTRYVRAWWVLPVTLMLLPDHVRLHSLLSIIPSLLVVSTMTHPGTLLSKLLESAPFRFIGRISYSLYLWQQIFLCRGLAPNLLAFGWLNGSWLVWPFVFATATASYYLIEKPFVRLGHRIAAPERRAAPYRSASRPKATPATHTVDVAAPIEYTLEPPTVTAIFRLPGVQ
jgi:peptidoglycan/LPS O-acetylase OafA/YrhL